MKIALNFANMAYRAAERIRGTQGKYKNGAPQSGLCEGIWGHAPRKLLDFANLHTLKCVLEAPEALFRAHIHLQVAVFD